MNYIVKFLLVLQIYHFFISNSIQLRYGNFELKRIKSCQFKFLKVGKCLRWKEESDYSDLNRQKFSASEVICWNRQLQHCHSNDDNDDDDGNGDDNGNDGDADGNHHDYVYDDDGW